jgi:proliferating cell nuclear antigen
MPNDQALVLQGPGQAPGNGNFKLELRTTQAVAFKLLIEALKELLIDTSIEFDETGMKIMAMDTSHVVLVHLKLEASKFEQYYCDGKVTVGLNMLNLHKLIKTINNNNILSLFIDRDDVNHLGIRIDNNEKNTRSIYKLNLMDLDQIEISVDPSEFTNVVTMPTQDFQKICRDMHHIAEFMEIRSVQNQLIFSCRGDFCSQETVVCDNNSNSANGNNSAENSGIVQGVFSIKHLVLFTKCTNLCSMMELYLKNDFPLIIKYDVSSIGSIRLVLAPQGGA